MVSKEILNFYRYGIQAINICLRSSMVLFIFYCSLHLSTYFYSLFKATPQCLIFALGIFLLLLANTFYSPGPMESDSIITPLSAPTRYAWSIFFIFVIVSSLGGDTLILYATLRQEKYFRLHRFIKVIIQHMAVCDLLMTTCAVLPRTVSLLSGRWLFGDLLCKVLPLLNQVLSVAGMFLVSFMILSKLLILVYPRHATRFTVPNGHKVSFLAWALSCSAPFAMLSTKKTDIAFDYRIYTCYFTSVGLHWLTQSIITAALVFPPLIVLISSIFLLKHLAKARRTSARCGGILRWQGITTTLVVAIVYCVSTGPYAFYRFSESFIHSNRFHRQYYMVASTLFFLNTISNFYIYSCTLTSFREFLKSILQGWYTDY